MDLTTQIRELKAMVSFLKDFCFQVDSQMSNLQNDLHTYKREGFPLEKAEKYEIEYYNKINSDAHKVISEVYSSHIPYLEERIKLLERALKR